MLAGKISTLIQTTFRPFLLTPDRIHYFTTTIRGAGIFLPIGRALKRASSPRTPNSLAYDTFNVLEKESQRAPTPSLHPKVRSRPSLPRPESPLRRAMPAGGGGVSLGTGDKAASRQSLSNASHNRSGLTKVTASPAATKMTVRPQPIKNNPKPEEDEIARLRTIIQEKNDKIAELTADFDRHRADFRNTINTLDLASIETQRVYEKRIDDLLLEQGSLTAQNEDVVSVAYQLHQLEEVVQELEDGLEDARRGEAEARGEVEFLRGEVERVRAELRREKEKEQVQVQVSPNNGHQQAPVVVFDGDKWCALCEEDGHDSISCPYEKS